MASISYQKKLSHQFTRYVAAMVLLFFAAFTMTLLIYTLGFNTYQNAKYNKLLSASFDRSYSRYATFLQSVDTQELLLRRLKGEVSDNYTAYYYNSFGLTTGMSSGLILSDAGGEFVYSSVGNRNSSTHLRYFNHLIQQNMTDSKNIYNAVYYLFGQTSQYVFSIPLFWEDGSMAGAAAIYVDGSGWEHEMRQNQFDGVITDQDGHIIAASNRAMLGGINRFQPRSGSPHLYNGQKYWLSTSYQPERRVYIHTFLQNNGIGTYYVIALSAISVLLLTLFLTGQRFARRIANLNSQSLETLYREINVIQRGNSGYRLVLETGDEFEDIADHINTMLDHVESLATRNLELLRLNNQMERMQLEAQFDPHFLYNSLETIRYAIRLGDKNADDIILKLTALLRYSVSVSEETVVLRDDLRHLQDYVDIIQYRFQGRLRYDIQIPEHCLNHPCPKLLLQPIVENSIKYSLPQRQLLTVTIRGWEDQDFLFLELRDNGLGMNPELLTELQAMIVSTTYRGAHHGLKNIARRLSLQFGLGSGMELHSVGGEGTTVLLRIAHREEVL